MTPRPITRMEVARFAYDMMRLGLELLNMTDVPAAMRQRLGEQLVGAWFDQCERLIDKSRIS